MSAQVVDPDAESAGAHRTAEDARLEGSGEQLRKQRYDVDQHEGSGIEQSGGWVNPHPAPLRVDLDDDLVDERDEALAHRGRDRQQVLSGAGHHAGHPSEFAILQIDNHCTGELVFPELPPGQFSGILAGDEQASPQPLGLLARIHADELHERASPVAARRVHSDLSEPLV